MLLSTFAYHQSYWQLYHKVTFDGVAKTITINPGESIIDVKKDIYSDWKEWVMLEDYAKYLPALRTIGGDSIGGGQYAGDIYFLINGWRIVISEATTINGVIFSDNYPSPFIINQGGGVVNKVSNLAIAYNTTGGAGGATAAEVWSYGARTLTSDSGPTVQQIRAEMDINSTKLATLTADTTTIKNYTDTLETQVGLVKTKVDTLVNGPTAVEIREELDTNSTKLTTIAADVIVVKNATDTLESSATSILNAIGDIAIASSAINTPAVGFQVVAGTVTSGTYLDTRTTDVAQHVIADNSLAFDVNYTFDLGLNSVPADITIIGAVNDQHEILSVGAWNYTLNSWEKIGEIKGQQSSTTFPTSKFILYPDHVGKVPGEIGDVKIRFYSTALSDIHFHVDQLYVSYATLPATTGYSGHVLSATASTIQLGVDASSVDNYYAPALITVNHGTGAMQYAKVISYTGTTKTLQLELPMATTLDNTSHITLSPWATANMPATQQATLTSDIVSQMSGLSPQQSTMLLEMYNLLGLDPTKPLTVTKTSRTVTGINQTIVSDANSTVVTRV